MFKNSKLYIILATISLFILIAGVLFFPVVSINNIKSGIINDYNNSVEILSNKEKLADYQEGANFQTVNEKFRKNYEFVFSSRNVINPVVTIVYEDNFDSISHQVLKMKRTSIFEFSVEKRYFGRIKNKSFSEAVELAKKYDFSKENPDPENITVEEPPTREEVEERKKSEENAQKYQKEIENCYNEFGIKAREQNLYDENGNFINTPENVTKANILADIQYECLEQYN